MYIKTDMNEYLTTTSMGSASLMTPNTMKTIEHAILASLDQTSSNPTITASAATGSFLPPLPSSTIIVQPNNWQGGKVSSSQSDHTHQHQLILTNNISANSASLENSSNRIGYVNVSNNAHQHQQQLQQFAAETTDTDDDSYTQEVKKPRRGNSAAGGSGGGRKTAGRKPRGAQSNGNSGSGDEEDDRKKIRRERNKLAAARCRRRRVDLTNKLMEQTDKLEQEKRKLQEEIQAFSEQKGELEYILQAHMEICSKSHLNNIVNTPTSSTMSNISSNLVLSSPSASSLLLQKPKRPTSLTVIKQEPQSSHMIPTSHGIPISTPSNGLAFDTLVDWLPPTGLTPTASSAPVPLMTPNTCNAVLSSLQTPTTSNNKFTAL